MDCYAALVSFQLITQLHCVRLQLGDLSPFDPHLILQHPLQQHGHLYVGQGS